MLKAYINKDIKNVTSEVLDSNKELLYNLAYNKLMLENDVTTQIKAMNNQSQLKAKVYDTMLTITDIRQFDRYSLTGQLLEDFLTFKGLVLEDINCAEVTDTTVTFLNAGTLSQALGIEPSELIAFGKTRNIQVIF